MVSEAEYQGYAQADIAANQAAITTWGNADWHTESTGYTEVEDPNLEALVIGGTYTNGGLADTRIMFPVGAEGFTGQTLRWKYCGNIGEWYPCMVKISVSPTGAAPWTELALVQLNFHDWHWQEVEIKPFDFVANTTYWLRFQTMNQFPYYASLGASLCRIYMDQPQPPAPTFDEAKKQWTVVDDEAFAHTARFSVAQREGSDVWPTGVYYANQYYWPQMSHPHVLIGGDWFYEYGGLTGPGKAFLEVLHYTAGEAVIPAPTQFVYPFGAYYDSLNPVFKSKEDIHPVLKAALEAEGLSSGFTIWPSRNDIEGVHREPDLRVTKWVLSRFMPYGDIGNQVLINQVRAYVGALWTDAEHNCIEWQVSSEPDPFGDATFRHRYQVIDYPTFDAFYFRCGGIIQGQPMNDGGIYLDFHSRSGIFQAGETITEADSGATATVVWANNDEYNECLGLTNLTGTWLGGKTFTGGASGATGIGDPEGPEEYYDDKGYLQAKGKQCFLIISNYDSQEFYTGLPENNCRGTAGGTTHDGYEGEYSEDGPNPHIAHYVLNNPDEYIDQIVDIAVNEGWDGITINLEWVPAVDRNLANGFFKALAQALHAQGKILHMTAPARTGTAYDWTPWTDWCDYGYLVRYVDRVKIMTYTESGSWGDAAPHAPDWFFTATYDFVQKVVHERFWPRILAGCNTSADLWLTGGVNDYVSYHVALAQGFLYGAEIKYREGEGYWTTHGNTAYFGAPLTIRRAILEAINRGFGGIGIWKADDGDIYEHFPTYLQFPALGVYPVAFNENRFPEDISYGAIGGPTYSTNINRKRSAHETCESLWPVGLIEYDVRHGVKNAENFAKLLTWFRTHRGKAYPFRFKDWQDFKAVDQLLGVGDGETITFQMIKKYEAGSLSETRTLTKIVAGTVVLKLDSTEQVEGVDFELNYNTGLFSFYAPPAEGKQVIATCEFDVPMRFDIDKMRSTYEAFQVHSWESITLIEVRDIT